MPDQTQTQMSDPNKKPGDANKTQTQMAFPQKIGPYQLHHQLGQDGMGTVYLSERQDHVTMQVAIILITSKDQCADLLTRFERERQVLADLKHPNICVLLDAGITEIGALAMDFSIDGKLQLKPTNDIMKKPNEVKHTKQLQPSIYSQTESFLKTGFSPVSHRHMHEIWNS